MYNFGTHNLLCRPPRAAALPGRNVGTALSGSEKYATGRRAGIWRVLAREDDTIVEFTPSVFHPGNTGSGSLAFELETNEDFVVEASKPPVMVANISPLSKPPDPGAILTTPTPVIRVHACGSDRAVSR